MFGYHDSNRCYTDLWSPVNGHFDENADPVQHGYGVWEDTPYASAIENRAFSAYAKHKTECDDIVEMIDEAVSQGRSYSNIQLDDDFSDADLRYIESECRKRGMWVKLDLS